MSLFSLVSDLGGQTLISQNFTITSIPVFLSTALGWGLVIGAVLVFGCIVISGFQLATAGNEPAKAKSAKDSITNCLLGFGVLASTWAIALVVQFFLGVEVLQSTPSAPSMCAPEGSSCASGNSCCPGFQCYSPSQICGVNTNSCKCTNNPQYTIPLCVQYTAPFAPYGPGDTGSICPSVSGSPRTCICAPNGFVAPTSTPTPTPTIPGATNTPTIAPTNTPKPTKAPTAVPTANPCGGCNGGICPPVCLTPTAGPTSSPI